MGDRGKHAGMGIRPGSRLRLHGRGDDRPPAVSDLERALQLYEAVEGHCLLVLDVHGRLCGASDRASAVLGRDADAMVGASPERIFAHSYVFETLLALAATMSPVEHHDDILLGDGSLVPAWISVSAVVDGADGHAGYALLVCVRRDQASGAPSEPPVPRFAAHPAVAGREAETIRRALREILAARSALIASADGPGLTRPWVADVSMDRARAATSRTRCTRSPPSPSEPAAPKACRSDRGASVRGWRVPPRRRGRGGRTASAGRH